MKIARNISITIICVILGVMLAWQYKSIYNNNKTVSTQNTRLEVLKDELLTEKNNNEDLRKRNEELENRVREFEDAMGDLDLYEKNLKSELERTRLIAGLSTVNGSGVVITVKNTESGVVQFGDILRLVNELKAAEAQAISVNEERIVAMTEIIMAGSYIVINGKQMEMKEPFVIKAIAEPEKLENSLKMLGGVLETLQDLYNLDVTVVKKDSIEIPKVRDDGSVLKYDLLTPVK